MDFDYTTETITPDSTNILTIGGTGGLELPVGTTAQRPGSPTNGLIRYNVDTGMLEGYFSNTWANAVNAIANRVIVQKDPSLGQYGSIAAAVASITTASATTPWEVIVYPGTYLEPEMTIPSYVNINGSTEYAVIVKPITGTQNLFHMSNSTSINFIDIKDVGVGFVAITADNVGNYALCHKVTMTNCDTGWSVSSTTADSTLYLEYCDTTGGTVAGVSASSSGAFLTYLNLENFYVYADDVTGINPEDGLFATGIGTTVFMRAFSFEGSSGTGHAIHAQDGAKVAAQAGSVALWDIGVNVLNSGASPHVECIGVESEDNTTWDLIVEHPTATGSFTGIANHLKVNATAAPLYSLAYSDADNNAFVQTGQFLMGVNGNTLTSVNDLIFLVPPMGLISGGVVTVSLGLTLAVASGTGYLRRAGLVTNVSWAAGTVAITPGTSPYIYINTAGAIATALSRPDPLTTILLSRALAGASTIITLGKDATELDQFGTRIDYFLREAVGPLYISGSIVTENATTARALDVTAGKWLHSTQTTLPSAGTAITFLDVIQVAGTTSLQALTQVNNTTYLSGGNLVAMTAGYYAKHTLYSQGEAPNQVFFMQHADAQYATYQLALDAPLPLPLINPDGVPHIAFIITQDGTANIINITDIRPKLGGTTIGTSGTSAHGNLTGLANDDHTQYLLVNGTRAMSGNLSLATNNITNVGTVNGVVVETHASRHLPNGADAITTAIAVSCGPSSVNSIGIANSLSRSDHVHNIFGVQPVAATLTALAAFNTNGILTQTAADTFTGRTITGTTSRVAVTAGNGVAGNPTIDIDAAYVGQSSITTLGTVATGTWNGTTIAIANGGTGQTTASAAFNALSPITTLGDIVYGSGTNTATRLAGNITTVREFLRQTGTGTVSAAPVWDTVTKTDVGLSNVENTALSTWAGSTNLVTLGSVTTGAWSATTIAANHGGTGISSYSIGDILYANTISTLATLADVATGNALISGGVNTAPSWGKISLTTHVSGVLPIANGGTSLSALGTANQVLGVNAAGTAAEYKTVTAGTAISVTPTAGVLTIANTGVTSNVAGTGISVSAGTGTVTITNSGVTSNVAGTGISVSAGTGTVTITNSGVTSVAGTAGNITASASTGAVTFNLATAGTAGTYSIVTTDTFGRVTSGSVVTGIANGGTGLSALGTANQIIGVNTGATALEYKTVTAGTAIGISNAAGAVTINNLGVTSNVAGTGISVSAGTGAVTITNNGVTSAIGTAGNITVSAATGAVTYNLATAGTAGTYGVVTTDTFGRVTSGSVVTGIANGGTGTSTAPTSGQVLVGTSGGIYAPATVGSGTGITVTAGSGTLSIANAGVTSAIAGAGISVSGGTGAVTITNTGATSIIGTANQITASASTGAVTLSTPSAFIAPGSVKVTTALYESTTNAITAAGTTQGTATALTTSYNVVTTVATGTGVILPTAAADGWIVTVINRGANALTVYPTVGASIDGGAINNPVTLPAGQTASYASSTSTTQWYSVIDAIYAGAGVTITGGTGGQTITNAGVTSATGTAGNITVSAGTGAVTFNLATAGTAGTYGQVTTDAYGRVTGGGTNSVANGGTGLTTVGGAYTLLGVNAAGTGLEYKTATAGTGISLVAAAGSFTIANTGVTSIIAGTGVSVSSGTGAVTVNNTGVTSVGLALPSIFTVSGSPVTTTGTLTGTLASQTAKTVFAAPTGAAGTPTFRTLALASDLSDVVITAPTLGQVISYSGTNWINAGTVGANAAGLIGVGQSGAAAWTLLSGTRYYADFAHNLATTNVVITLFNTSDNSVIIADSIVLSNTNTVRVTVIGNTRTIRVVVVANGQSIVAGGSTPSSVVTALNGVTVSTAATKLNFSGQAVNVTDAGSGTTNIVIGSRFTFFANSLDSPVNADFAINALSAVVTDPAYASLNVRSFSNTIEQGVACLVSIPSGATTATFKIRGRAQTAPGVASVVQPRIYYRLLPNNGAVAAWSAAQELANIAIPTNANFQYAQQTIALATLGMTAGNLYQIEMTRRIAGVTGTNLAANFLMAEFTVEFA